MSARPPPSRSSSASSSSRPPASSCRSRSRIPFWMVLFLVLTAVTFSLFGFIIGIWADGFEKLQIVPLLIVTPLTFLGGSFYSIDMLPPFWQTVTLVQPGRLSDQRLPLELLRHRRRERRRQPGDDARLPRRLPRDRRLDLPDGLPAQGVAGFFRGDFRHGAHRRLRQAFPGPGPRRGLRRGRDRGGGICGQAWRGRSRRRRGAGAGDGPEQLRCRHRRRHRRQPLLPAPAAHDRGARAPGRPPLCGHGAAGRREPGDRALRRRACHGAAGGPDDAPGGGGKAPEAGRSDGDGPGHRRDRPPARPPPGRLRRAPPRRLAPGAPGTGVRPGPAFPPAVPGAGRERWGHPGGAPDGTHRRPLRSPDAGGPEAGRGAGERRPRGPGGDRRAGPGAGVRPPRRRGPGRHRSLPAPRRPSPAPPPRRAPDAPLRRRRRRARHRRPRCPEPRARLRDGQPIEGAIPHRLGPDGGLQFDDG